MFEFRIYRAFLRTTRTTNTLSSSIYRKHITAQQIAAQHSSSTLDKAGTQVRAHQSATSQAG